MENIYHRGKVYRIVCNTTGKTYYGSTCEPTLAQRLAKHICEYKKKKNGESMYASACYELFENNNYEIILCESVKCESKDELRMCERKWIEGNECVNKYRPIVSREERSAHRREYSNIYNKPYYDNNKQIILEKQRIYKQHRKDTVNMERRQKIICECGCEISKSSLYRHKKSKIHIKLMENK